MGPQVMRYIEKEVMLRTLDQHWREHLAAMDYMRQGIFLRSYAQKNPKQEYKREAFELFSAMLDRIKFDTVTTVSKIQVRSQAEIEREEFERQQRLARALQMQHADAISPIQAGRARGARAERRRQPGAGGAARSRRPPSGAAAAPGARRSCARCPRWAAMRCVPAVRARNTSIATAPCSKRAVERHAASGLARIIHEGPPICAPAPGLERDFPGRRKSVPGGCGKNILFFTPRKIPFQTQPPRLHVWFSMHSSR